MGVRVTSRIIPFAAAQEVDLDRAVLMMATDIDRTAKILAPKLTHALEHSIKVNRKGKAHYSVSAGDSQVPYARRRHFENRKHPGTLLYLKRAGDAATSNPAKYLRKI